MLLVWNNDNNLLHDMDNHGLCLRYNKDSITFYLFSLIANSPMNRSINFSDGKTFFFYLTIWKWIFMHIQLRVRQYLNFQILFKKENFQSWTILRGWNTFFFLFLFLECVNICLIHVFFEVSNTFIRQKFFGGFASLRIICKIWAS